MSVMLRPVCVWINSSVSEILEVQLLGDELAGREVLPVPMKPMSAMLTR